jgi:hypothetical protein
MRPPLRLAPHLVGCLTLGAGGLAASHFWKAEPSAEEPPTTGRDWEPLGSHPGATGETTAAFAIDLPTHDAPTWNIQAGLDAWQAEGRSSNLERLLKDKTGSELNMPSDCPLTEQQLKPPRPWLDSQTRPTVEPINDPSTMVAVGSRVDQARPLPPLPTSPNAPQVPEPRSPGQLVRTQIPQPQPLAPPPSGPLLRPGQGLIFSPHSVPSAPPNTSPANVPPEDSQPTPRRAAAGGGGAMEQGAMSELERSPHSATPADHIIRQPSR